MNKGASSSLPLDPRRLRRLPPTGFGWIDRRFFHEGFAAPLSTHAALMYAFLCIAADSRGQSWYGDPRLGQILRLLPGQVLAARRELIQADLIRYERPDYQVLSLPESPDDREPVAKPTVAPTDGPRSIGTILHNWR